MAYKRHFLSCIVVTLGVLLAGLTEPADAQGRGNGRGTGRGNVARPRVTVELALSATRDVLVGQGFDVVRIEEQDDLQIIYYRRGNNGRGRGRGPIARLVLRRVEETIEIEEAPVEIKLEIELKLGIRLN